MPGGNGSGPIGRGSGLGRGMQGSGQRPAKDANNPEWLVNLVGTVVLALGSIAIRALTRKAKSAPENEAKTGDIEKKNN